MLPGERAEIREPTAIPESAMIALMPAAVARPVIGDSRNTRCVRHQEAFDEPRTGYSADPSIRTFSISRFSNDVCAYSAARSGAATCSRNAASSARMLSS